MQAVVLKADPPQPAEFDGRPYGVTPNEPLDLALTGRFVRASTATRF